MHRKYLPDSFPSPANLAKSNRASFLTFAGRSSKDPKSPRNKLVNTCVMIIFLKEEDQMEMVDERIFTFDCPSYRNSRLPYLMMMKTKQRREKVV